MKRHRVLQLWAIISVRLQSGVIVARAAGPNWSRLCPEPGRYI